MEEFKVLKHYPAYRISNCGKLQSRWRIGVRKKDNPYKEWRDYKQKIDIYGYAYVNLCDGVNKPKTTKIHNIVLMEFVGEKPKGMCVRHLDSNKFNNSLSNLSYGTYLENENDKHANGTWHTRITNRKLTALQINEIINKCTSGEKDKDLAIEYNVSRPTITRIRNNKIWKR